MYCEKCGKELMQDTIICPQCNAVLSNRDISGEREWFFTFLMSWFGGFLGIHRLYTGYTGIAIAQFFTLGGCGIWSLIDFIMICIGEYETSDGKKLRGYTRCLGLPAIVMFMIMAIINLIRVLLSFHH